MQLRPPPRGGKRAASVGRLLPQERERNLLHRPSSMGNVGSKRKQEAKGPMKRTVTKGHQPHQLLRTPLPHACPHRRAGYVHI